MDQGLVHLHNLLRWVVLILLIVAIVKHGLGLGGRRPFTPSDRKVGLFLMISAHIQLLVGLVLWFIGPWGYKLIQNVGMAEAMKNPVQRFFTVEHNTGMLIAIILITIGRGAAKKIFPTLQSIRGASGCFLSH